MKIKFFWKYSILISIVSFIFVGCSKESLEQDTLVRKNDIERKIDFLVDSYGFNRKDVHTEGSKIIAEGDILFDIDGFWDKYSSKNRAHYYCGNVVSPSNRRIYVTTAQEGQAGALPVGWLTALIYAIQDWNALGGPIHFTINSAEPHDDVIVVVYVPINDINVIANAQHPSNGRPGNIIRINSSRNDEEDRPLISKRQVLIHELGHTIGLAHTDQPSSGTLIPITDCAEEDVNSVMQRYALPNPSLPLFTPCDIMAYRHIYGIPY